MRDALSQPLTLDPAAPAVAAARRYVADVLTDLGALSVLDSAELGVSELVTNAVLHARTPLTVSVRNGEVGPVRIEVTDGSALTPQQRRLSLLSTTGRGLRLVASLSSEWGVTPSPADDRAGKTVWFEPVEEPTMAGFAEAEWAADLEALLR